MAKLLKFYVLHAISVTGIAPYNYINFDKDSILIHHYFKITIFYQGARDDWNFWTSDLVKTPDGNYI